MRKFGLLGTSALRSAIFISAAAAMATPSYGQTTAAPATSPGDEVPGQSEAEIESGTNAQAEGDGSGVITVTGSRIRRPNLESSVPITSIGGEEFFQQGQTNIGDTLNDLPQLRSTFSQSNSGRFLGTAGLNLLDLRGLGTTRTLVLVNGRRHVGGDIRSSASTPDVNMIPNDLIERVDIVTGASSAIYGSDAIAGVVNFVLRRQFQGLQVRGHAGISDYGAGGHQYASAMYGMNFGDGRGNLTVHGEYAKQDRVFLSEIPFLRSNDGFGVVDTDPAGTPNGSDGIPDRTFFRDFRTAANAIEGLIPITQPVTGNLCGLGFTGLPFNCTFLVQPDGSLVPQTGSRFGSTIIGGIVGGNGNTQREGNLVSVFPKQARYNFNLLGHFALSEAFEPFIEAKYARVDVQGQSSSPAFVQGVTFGDPREKLRLDNPFLPAATRTQITNLIRASGFQPSLTTRTPLTAADQTALNNGSFRFVIARSLLDLGVRDEVSKRDTYRAVAGVRGTFNDDWSYEVSANYGQVNETTTVLGNINQQRFLLALDAGIDPLNPSAGIQCRSKFDPAAQAPFANIPNNGGATTIAADIAACVPYNPFGTANNSAARNYIVTNTTATSYIKQAVLSGFLSGDTSEFFNLPGGPIGVAIGAEYRKEDIRYDQDPLVSGGFTFYNALPSFNPKGFDVKEAFAEVRLPLLKDTPFFEELTVSGAGRVADYGGTIGTVFAYNGGVEWSPVRDIRFRANYGRSVRAPGIRATSDPQSQNFAPGFGDPCLPQNIGNNPNRPANCAVVLGPNLTNPDFITLPNYSLEFKSGSNPLLTEETSDSITVGAVVQPRFIPGLSLTVDYYDIKVNNVISAVGANAIVTTCVDLPSADNPFCKLIQRNPGPGKGPKDEVPGQILQGTLVSASVNFAALKRKGVDFEVAYRRALGANSRLDTKLIYTHVIQISNFVNPVLPDFENRVLSELGDPQDEFQWSVDLKVDQVTFGYQMRYIGKQTIGAYEDTFELPGACTPAGCPPNNADFADLIYYPSVLYHDFRVNVEVRPKFDFYVGVDNFMNKKPPLGLTAIGDGSAIYNIRGRQFFAGFKARF
jgi:outer membrane receptor protein involved in Fe transport